MLFFVNPQQHYYDPEQAFLDYKRRQYIAALEEQEQRAQFERELALEEQRHRLALQSIARKEAARRQHQEQQHRQRFATRYAMPDDEYAHSCCAPRANKQCHVPSEEVLKRRKARQEEEERRSRDFHKYILSQIFGVDPEETEANDTPASNSANTKGKGKETEEASTAADSTPTKRSREQEEQDQPHWSSAPERSRSLAEISSITRTFESLKNTFTFPSGPLERLPDSGNAPRLAYNATNATIHAYEHALSELLTRLDGVESFGFKGVREARKKLVVKIEKELEELERRVAERLAENASPAKATVDIPVESTTTTAPTTTKTATTAPPAEIIIPIEGPSDDETAKAVDVTMEDSTTEPQQKTIDIEVDNTAGYDVEPEPTSTVNDSNTVETNTETNTETHIPAPQPAPEPTPLPVASTNDAEAMEVETQDVAAGTDSESVPVTINNGDPKSDAPASTTPVVAAVEPTDTALTSSGEESEIEDAVHVDVYSSDDEDGTTRRRDNADHSDGAFEML